MKFYLSSYRLGEKTEELKKLVPAGRIGYIPNALDSSGVDRGGEGSTLKKILIRCVSSGSKLS